MKEKTEYPKMNERKNITFKHEWKNTKTWQIEKKKKNIQIEWKELKTRKNKKTIIKYAKTVKNWINTNRMNNKSDKFVH